MYKYIYVELGRSTPWYRKCMHTATLPSLQHSLPLNTQLEFIDYIAEYI